MGLRPPVVPYLLLCFCVVNAIKPQPKAEDFPGLFNTYNNYNNPVPATPHNPWISGPTNKKYQFHVGQQSWLGAREICLAENSDLLTIQSQEELDWVLSHYKPQLKQFRERQLQIGLLVDTAHADSSYLGNWKWADGSLYDPTLLKWSPGEPFDHAGGRERCAILNINRKTIEDVDCDLSGNPLNFYRFICERSHLHHIKHEELNNPLWKKLEDILVFFGISQSSSAAANETTLIASDPQLEDEDYMDTVRLNTTESSTVEGSGEEPKPTEQQKTSEWTADPAEADELLPKTTENVKPAKTLNDGPPFPSAPASVAAHGTKLAETIIQNDADLLTNKELEKLDRSEAKESVKDATTDPTLQRTTKSDPLESLADTLEHEMSKESHSIGDRMHQLEHIINAVQTMLEEPDKEEKTDATKVVLPTTTELPKGEPTTTEGLEIVQLIEKQNRELVDQNVVDAGEPHEQVITALNLEGDFEHAKVEAKAHPNTNSGDFLLLGKQEELVGCGVKNLGGTRPPTPTNTSAPAVNKTEQVNKLLDSLRGLLTDSSSDVLSDLLANGNDPKTVVEKLQKVAQEVPPPTTTRSPAEVQKMRKRVEYEILKSLEELGEVESQEFVDMKNNNHELEAIGSGLEPPSERLITLSPIALTAHQIVTNDSTASPVTETAKKSAEGEGFDATLMLHLPKKDEPKKKDESTQQKIAIPESEEEESDVVRSLRAKFQRKSKLASSGESSEGSGLSVSSEADDKSMERLNADSESVFPKPDFSLIKNKKLEAESKKNLALEKQRVDKASEQFNSKFDSQSLLERIRQSEAERAKSPDGTVEAKTEVNATDTSTMAPHDEQLAKTLQEIFDDWMELLGRRR